MLEVYNSLGQMIYEEGLGMHGNGNQEVLLSVQDFAPGTYTVILKAGPNTGVGKIVRYP